MKTSYFQINLYLIRIATFLSCCIYHTPRFFFCLFIYLFIFIEEEIVFNNTRGYTSLKLKVSASVADRILESKDNHPKNLTVRPALFNLTIYNHVLFLFVFLFLFENLEAFLVNTLYSHSIASSLYVISPHIFPYYN